MRSLGVICARAASKRLPRKNLRPLNGVPLVAYCASAARRARLDSVIVSTEDREIAAICVGHGVEAPFVRPEELAADYASSPDIVGHAVDWMRTQRGLDYDIVVVLQPTTPFVLPEHIDACVDALKHDAGAACCFTARPASEPPQWMFMRGEDGRVSPLLGEAIGAEREHAQLLATHYLPNGAAYAVRLAALAAQRRIICDPARIVVMPPERSVDIDDELDWLFAERVARHYSLTPCG